MNLDISDCPAGLAHVCKLESDGDQYKPVHKDKITQICTQAVRFSPVFSTYEQVRVYYILHQTIGIKMLLDLD